MKDFRTLNVWERGNRLTLAVYKATAKFPRDELYGLMSQIRRSCVSVPVNIAEGCGVGSAADLARFPQVAAGSASELEYHILGGRRTRTVRRRGPGVSHRRNNGGQAHASFVHKEAES